MMALLHYSVSLKSFGFPLFIFNHLMDIFFSCLLKVLHFHTDIAFLQSSQVDI